MSEVADIHDYVIVGAGSAGCVLADRLTRDGRRSVLLIEAGPEDSSPLIRMPKGFGKLLGDPRHVWWFDAQPEAGGPNTPARWHRGKALGGSSAVINRYEIHAHRILPGGDGHYAVGVKVVLAGGRLATPGERGNVDRDGVGV